MLGACAYSTLSTKIKCIEAIILAASRLGKLEQRYEMFGVMCLPELMFAGSDYTVLTSRSGSLTIPPSAGRHVYGYNSDIRGGSPPALVRCQHTVER